MRLIAACPPPPPPHSHHRASSSRDAALVLISYTLPIEPTGVGSVSALHSFRSLHGSSGGFTVASQACPRPLAVLPNSFKPSRSPLFGRCSHFCDSASALRSPFCVRQPWRHHRPALRLAKKLPSDNSTVTSRFPKAEADSVPSAALFKEIGIDLRRAQSYASSTL